MNAALPALLLVLAPALLCAQSPGAPIYAEGPGARPLAAIAKNAKKLRESGALLSVEKVKEQSTRATCSLALPVPATEKLEAREIWKRSRAAHIRVGWLYLCEDKECAKWHLNLSGGYAITNDAVATCAHVTEPLEDAREAYLIAADDDDNLYPITEILATNRALDTAIVRIKGGPLKPLPLGRELLPGDTVYCFSDPMDRRGFFSEGMVNRFVKRPFLRKNEVQELAKSTTVTSASDSDASTSSAPAKLLAEVPTWIEVSTDWAPGSSGSAVVDSFGNAVGHVCEIESVLEDPLPRTTRRRAASSARGTLIIFHDAIGATNVLSLIKPPPSKPAPAP